MTARTRPRCLRHRDETHLIVTDDAGVEHTVTLSPHDLLCLAEQVNSAVHGLVWWGMYPPASSDAEPPPAASQVHRDLKRFAYSP